MKAINRSDSFDFEFKSTRLSGEGNIIFSQKRKLILERLLSLLGFFFMAECDEELKTNSDTSIRNLKSEALLQKKKIEINNHETEYSKDEIHEEHNNNNRKKYSVKKSVEHSLIF